MAEKSPGPHAFNMRGVCWVDVPGQSRGQTGDHELPATLIRGFAVLDGPGVGAVCLLPGSEIAFDRDIE
jgi:hypothetical protein